jgi:hypothetical protein
MKIPQVLQAILNLHLLHLLWNDLLLVVRVHHHHLLLLLPFLIPPIIELL